MCPGPLERPGRRKGTEIGPLTQTEITAVDTDVAMLDTLDAAGREVAVTSMLDQARQWLERAKESTAPAQDVAEFRAFVATVAEAAKQKKLSEDIQSDAVEMVRRSERALGQAIRKGQDEGSIRSSGQRSDRHGHAHPDAMSVRDFIPHVQESVDIYGMTDNVTDEQFESALTEAKEEGNLSRANVVRKVTELGSYREQQDDKWVTVAEFASQGFTSPQIAKTVGMTEEGLRAAARKKGIEFPADKLSNFKRIDPLYVIEQTVLGLEVTQSTLELVSYEGVTPQQASEWLERLKTPLRALRNMQTALKEIN